LQAINLRILTYITNQIFAYSKELNMKFALG